MVGCFSQDSFQVLLLERCRGGELFERVQSMDHFDELQAARWVREMLLGLEHLHSLDIIHRDLKPENLLLTSHAADAALKIADFGASKRINGTGAHTPCGTRGYVAPEQVALLDGSNVASYGRAADLWACGVVTHVLLSGRMPFDPTASSTSGEPSTPERR